MLAYATVAKDQLNDAQSQDKAYNDSTTARISTVTVPQWQQQRKQTMRVSTHATARITGHVKQRINTAAKASLAFNDWLGNRRNGIF